MSQIFNMRLFLFSVFKVIIRGTHARNPVCSVPLVSRFDKHGSQAERISMWRRVA